MASPTPSYLTEASDIAKDSIVPVSIVPSIVVGVIVFIIIMYIVSLLAASIKATEDTLTYNSQGCQVKSNGEIVQTPIYSSGKGGVPKTIIGYNKCATKTSPITIYGYGVFISIFLAVMAGSGIYKLQFYWSNPKLGVGLYAANMLFNRK